jgi:hypothetical protein
MTVFVPETILERWVYSVLVGSAAVTTALGSTQILPRVSPPAVVGRHITHGFMSPDGGIVAKPLGRPVTQVAVIWHITAWEPSYSTQALEPVMAAVQVAMTDALGNPTSVRFVETPQSWSIGSQWTGTGYVPMEVVPAGAWAPIRHLYRLEVSPVG